MASLQTAEALTLRSGEPFVMKFGLADSEGVPQLLTGRAFLLAIARVGATVASFTATATLSPDSLYAVMTFSGDTTAAIYDGFASRAADFAVMELIDDGQVTRGSGRLTVEASPAVPSDADPIVLLVPFVEALATPTAMLITEKGARGLSAVESFAIGGIDPEEPAAAAMFDALKAPAVEAAGVASAAADQAVAAAEAADAATQSILGDFVQVQILASILIPSGATAILADTGNDIMLGDIL